MYNRLYAFLIKYELLYSLQFGFRKYHATYMALVCMLDKLHDALEKGDFVIVIFIDFGKAFDTVDHSILLYELYHYGVLHMTGFMITWTIEPNLCLSIMFILRMSLFLVVYHRGPY